jgi:hypothetical protein
MLTRYAPRATCPVRSAPGVAAFVVVPAAIAATTAAAAVITTVEMYECIVASH